MLEIQIREERAVLEGEFGTQFEVIKTFIEFVEMPTPKHLINQRRVQTHARFKRKMWRYYNIPIINEVVNSRYFDQTWLHVPVHFSRILRWLSPPKKREPSIVEQFEAERDRLEFSDELSLNERLAGIRKRYFQPA